LGGGHGATVVETAVDLAAQDMPHRGDEGENLDVERFGVQAEQGRGRFGPAHGVGSVQVDQLTVALRRLGRLRIRGSCIGGGRVRGSKISDFVGRSYIEDGCIGNGYICGGYIDYGRLR
jgi:hypothetical protein